MTLKTHLWEDITSVILPSLLKHIGYIPIPRIGKGILVARTLVEPTIIDFLRLSINFLFRVVAEYTDSQLDLVIENLTLEGQNLLPNTVELEMRNYFKVGGCLSR